MNGDFDGYVEKQLYTCREMSVKITIHKILDIYRRRTRWREVRNSFETMKDKEKE